MKKRTKSQAAIRAVMVLLVATVGCESAASLAAGIFPAAIQVVSGNGQQATPGAALPEPLVARVLDADGNPVGNWAVTWEVVQGGGTLEPGTSTTDAFGYARKRWTLGATTGEQTVAARAATGQDVASGMFTALAVTGEEPPANVASVTVDPSVVGVQVGATAQLTATPRDANGAALAGRAVTWTSGNASLASVSSTGLITGVAPGTVTISATSEGVTGTATASVTVAPPPPPAAVASVSVTPATASVQVGATRQMTATPRDANGNALTGRSVAWSSSNTGRATVNASGLVTAVSTGTVQITATSEGQSGSATITVTAVPVATVTVAPATVSVQAGSTTTLSATLRDAAGNVLTGRTVTWSSGNTARATVSPSGVVTGVSAGTVTITATSEGRSGTSSVTVTAPPSAPVASVTLSPTTLNIETGGTAQITATLRDASGNILTGRTVTWSSSNAARATVANGMVTGVSAGTATITATSEGQSATANVTVVTTPPPSGNALFASNWSTATGATLTATRDGSRWQDTFCTNARGVVDVVTGSSVGFTLSQNVLRARELTEQDCFKVSQNVPGTPGQDYYVRTYIRNDVTRGQGQTITWHPFVIYVPQPQFVFWSNQGGGTSQYQWQIRAYSSSTGNANDHQWGQNLPISTWHRFEWHVQYIAVRSGDADVRVWPRVYDMAGNLIQDANTLRRTWTTSTQTLAQWYAAGNFFRLPRLADSRHIGLGTEGPAGAANSGLPWYYAGFEVRSDTWPGPIQQ